MLYSAYEVGQQALSPWRIGAGMFRSMWQAPINPLAATPFGAYLSASAEFLEQTTRRFGKPEWGLLQTSVNDHPVPIMCKTIIEKDFGNLVHFEKDSAALKAATRQKRISNPPVLIIAPMSGHFSTLLRGTVEAMLPEHDVYITDWANARDIPVVYGSFNLDDYIDYVVEFLDYIGSGAHTMAVCQPGPALLAAVALMSEQGHPALPSSMIFMGSPIDARKSPTVTNQLAEERDKSWFEKNMIYTVPAPYAGMGRRVYPGFLQLYSFMSLNSARHTQAHFDYFQHLVEGDGDSAQRHRKFYDEYLSVCDMTAEFYMQTINDVFQQYLLPRGKFVHRGARVTPEAITDVALMTVEGELDDISGIGQTQAAHKICRNLPEAKKLDYVQKGVGHYGVFHGRRWRSEIQPRLAEFIRQSQR